MYANPTNVTGLLSMLQYLNGTALNDMLGLGILLAITFIVLLSLLPWGSDRAFATTAIIGLVTSAFLRYLGLINDLYVFAFMLFAMIAIVYLYSQSTRY